MSLLPGRFFVSLREYSGIYYRKEAEKIPAKGKKQSQSNTIYAKNSLLRPDELFGLNLFYGCETQKNTHPILEISAATTLPMHLVGTIIQPKNNKRMPKVE